MTLDEAIAHAREKACGDDECAREHERLARWLEELKLARESVFVDIGLAARAVSENHDLKTEKGKRIEQILATDVTREQLAEALWCAEDSQRMWHGCAEENRNFRLKAEAENAKLRELVRCLVYATNPLDRATLIANAAELGLEVDG